MGMGKGAPRAVPVPFAGFDRQQVEAEILMNGNPLLLGPVEIGFDQEVSTLFELGGGFGFGNGFV